MSLMSNAVKDRRKAEKTKAVVNYMGGISFELSPVETLRMVTASSIFGEPQYYREGEFAQKNALDGVCRIDPLFLAYSVFGKEIEGEKTSAFMEKIIDNALGADFEATIRWALELRTKYFMRLNPQVIMVRAAMHPDRARFNAEHPGLFSEINAKVMSRADEPASQFTYFLFENGSKASVPNVLKRNWAKRLESASRYDVAKYKNHTVGMIDTVRVCHAASPVLDELMKTGTVDIAEDEKTWENMRSAGASWKEILETCRIGHMALLKNLRGIFSEIDDLQVCMNTLEKLKRGVEKGKQFPFRYMSAYEAVENAGKVHHKTLILDALEECIDLACENMPRLKGKTMCLTDNSGSAWRTCTSEYGTVHIAEIDNLSSVIAARNSDEGFVGKFGDDIRVFPVSKKNGVLEQTKGITEDRYRDVGGATENGIWLFFEKAIREKEHWDNIFIFSDMQAGHGGLYGTDDGKKAYLEAGFACRSEYIDVAKLIDAYRREVNPKVNVFSVQTAGYDNIVVPEYGYRTNILYGWTGKEVVFADEMIKFWDGVDADREKRKAAGPSAPEGRENPSSITHRLT